MLGSEVRCLKAGVAILHRPSFPLLRMTAKGMYAFDSSGNQLWHYETPGVSNNDPWPGIGMADKSWKKRSEEPALYGDLVPEISLFFGGSDLGTGTGCFHISWPPMLIFDWNLTQWGKGMLPMHVEFESSVTFSGLPGNQQQHFLWFVTFFYIFFSILIEVLYSFVIGLGTWKIFFSTVHWARSWAPWTIPPGRPSQWIVASHRSGELKQIAWDANLNIEKWIGRHRRANIIESIITGDKRLSSKIQ